jgi:hypothetical protein
MEFSLPGFKGLISLQKKELDEHDMSKVLQILSNSPSKG